MYFFDSGHTPSGCGKSEPHINVSTPISSISLVPTRSYWNVARHWLRQYPLGSFFSFRSWYWSLYSKSMRSSTYGIQPMPLSPSTMRMFGKRSNTAAPIRSVRIVASVIWKRTSPLYVMRREIDGSKDLRNSGSVAGKVWKCSGSRVSLTASQRGSQQGCHIGEGKEQFQAAHVVVLA